MEESRRRDKDGCLFVYLHFPCLYWQPVDEESRADDDVECLFVCLDDRIFCLFVCIFVCLDECPFVCLRLLRCLRWPPPLHWDPRRFPPRFLDASKSPADRDASCCKTARGGMEVEVEVEVEVGMEVEVVVEVGGGGGGGDRGGG